MDNIKTFLNSKLYKDWSKKFPNRASHIENILNVKLNKK